MRGYSQDVAVHRPRVRGSWLSHGRSCPIRGRFPCGRVIPRGNALRCHDPGEGSGTMEGNRCPRGKRDPVDLHPSPPLSSPHHKSGTGCHKELERAWCFKSIRPTASKLALSYPSAHPCQHGLYESPLRKPNRCQGVWASPPPAQGPPSRAQPRRDSDRERPATSAPVERRRRAQDPFSSRSIY